MNTKRLIKPCIFIIILCILFTNSCSVPGGGDSGPNIYVSGYYVNSSGDERACYWHKGSRYDLSSANPHADSRANHIIISGTNLYFAGFYTSSTAGVGTIPCYWQNFSRTDLGVTKGRANAIYVYGTDVYVAGEYGDLGSRVACYWKNNAGGRVDLPGVGGYQQDQGASIWVYNNTLYVGGSYYDSGSTAYVPCRWEASTGAVPSPTVIPYTPVGGALHDIRVEPAGVTACGYASTSEAYYWKNAATSYLLPDDAGNPTSGKANAFTLLDTIVYSAGYYEDGGTNVPCYWFNNSAATPLPGNDGEVLDIQHYADDGLLYSAGYYMDGADSVPCYWVGTTKYDLAGNNGRATGIVVMQ